MPFCNDKRILLSFPVKHKKNLIFTSIHYYQSCCTHLCIKHTTKYIDIFLIIVLDVSTDIQMTKALFFYSNLKKANLFAFSSKRHNKIAFLSQHFFQLSLR